MRKILTVKMLVVSWNLLSTLIWQSASPCWRNITNAQPFCTVRSGSEKNLIADRVNLDSSAYKKGQ